MTPGRVEDAVHATCEGALERVHRQGHLGGEQAHHQIHLNVHSHVKAMGQTAILYREPLANWDLNQCLKYQTFLS